MRSITRIPIWRTVVNWAAVVFLGSILAPVLVGEGDPEMFFLFMVISALCSLPALGLFILVNWAMNEQQLTTNRYRLCQGLIHFGASLVTFVFLGMVDGKRFWEDEFLLVVGGSYTGLGQIAWWITFYAHREHISGTATTGNHQNKTV